MSTAGAEPPTDWRRHLPEGVRPYAEAAPLAAAFLGISSGFAFAMIGAAPGAEVGGRVCEWGLCYPSTR